ncbi:transcriptional regulator [Catellatospora methionotrophica]|uniref:Transcriptional regulator n=1 Tax=Catellatospora methionotrophica TaxID=121620 RepID=A0A8J3PFM2_9ACTN|nr:helix-turn-helix transcriptional regulator [Catellatospora methionotrophica]GIG14508.1 transcriptional regulator [Catellatospora methionotrophica]
MADRWPFTGREAQLREIAALLRGPDGYGVVLAGAAGFGKSRLARAALAEAAERGAVTRWAAASSAARALPLGAFGALVTASDADPSLLLRRAAQALAAGTPPERLVIAVDDAHQLDDVSALLLHQLAVQRQARLLLTVRTGEPAPDLVTALWKDGYLQRVDLGPLPIEDTARLLDNVLGATVAEADIRRLWELTRGNVLYLRHLVTAEAAAGRLYADRGVWHWTGRPELPPGLTELVGAAMGELSPAEKAVTDLLALAEPLAVAVLAGLADPAAVEAAEQRGVVTVAVEDGELTARLAHPLYAEACRAALGTLRARRLRGAIAGALPGHDVLRRAVLLLDSDLDPDRDLFVAAGRQAAQLCDLNLSERLGRAGVAAGGGYAAQQLVTASLVGMARYERAEEEFAALIRLAASDDEVATAAVGQVLHLAFTAAQPLQAASALAEAERRVTAPRAASRLLAIRALLDGQGGRPQQAMASAEAALTGADVPDEAVLLGCSGLVIALGSAGRADEIQAVAQRALAAAAQSPELAFYAIPMTGLWTHGLVAAGYLGEAAAIAEEFRRTSGEMVFGREIATVLAGFVAMAQGRLGSALPLLRDARSALVPFGDAGGWGYTNLVLLAQAEAMAGDAAAASARLADAAAGRHATLGFLVPAEALARAWVLAATGAVSRARATAREAAAAAAAHGMAAYEVGALQAAVGFGDRDAAQRLAELSRLVQGPRVALAAAHAAALSGGDPARLDAAATAWEQAGELVAAADAAAQAAVLWAERGRHGSAAGAAARAHRIAASTGGLRTPALVAAARPLPVSEREREVITLAAAGLSNREIAERLFVSVRTVEGHVYRAGAKTGVSARARFRDLLEPP